MNKEIKNIVHKTYHGVNLDTVEFELYGNKYRAIMRWNDNGDITECYYYRVLPNYYFDSYDTIFNAKSDGQNNREPDVLHFKISKEDFEKLYSQK